MRKVNRSAKSGKFVDKQTAQANPNETVTESYNSDVTLLIDHVRDYLNSGAVIDIHWRSIFEGDMQRIDRVSFD